MFVIVSLPSSFENVEGTLSWPRFQVIIAGGFETTSHSEKTKFDPAYANIGLVGKVIIGAATIKIMIKV